MSNIRLVFGHEARQGLYEGIAELNRAVSCTLGPLGRNVLMRKFYHGIHPTKDGVTVAEQVSFDEELKNMGAMLIKQASESTNDLAGDGTTTSTLLAHEMIRLGLEKIPDSEIHLKENTINVTQFRNGMEKAVDDIIDYLKWNVKIDINGNMDMIQNVATISANNDKNIGIIIADALEKIGIDGKIKVESSSGSDTYMDVVKGIKFDQGYASPYFITDTDSKQVIYSNPAFILVSGKLESPADLAYMAVATEEPIVIIAHDFSERFLASAVTRKYKMQQEIVLVKAPYFGQRRDNYMDDMSVLLGNYPIAIPDIRTKTYQNLGRAEKCVITDSTTLILNGKGLQIDIDDVIADIEGDMKDLKDPKSIDMYEERISMLKGGIGVLYVGASSPAELKEKMDRMDDALSATQAAIEEGIVPGGGIALLNASFILPKVVNQTISHEQGYDVVMEAIKKPFSNILGNAGFDNEYISNKIEEIQNGNFKGINAVTGESCNMIKAGIIDPFKVTRVALENAVSVAGIVLTTECVLVDDSLQQKESDLPAYMQ